ncbi:glycosyltransferase [Agrobacterium larrymoorei]|uniref:Glycosyltransferase n=1 Tax=Agrobacterium larrymoorei TaxID=160699 RepID=A0AAF0HAM6_9HYPH|nr:glycosyltransferase [Agrobacterium larrymoorei]WHA42578.1 glycosyltransferase [Agrobacterium larrymoorei]
MDNVEDLHALIQARLDDGDLHVELEISSDDQLSLVEQVRLKLQHHPRKILLKIIRHKNDENQKDLAVSFIRDNLHLQNCLGLLSRDKSYFWTLHTPVTPLFIPENVTEVVLPVGQGNDLFWELISVSGRKKICFLTDETVEPWKAAPIQFLNQCVADKLVDLFRLDGSSIHPLTRGVDSNSKVLFIFPERMLPLGRAYFQRAFNLLISMNRAGVDVDVFLLGPKNKDLQKIQNILSAFSPKVHAFPLSRAKLSLVKQGIRKIESWFAKRGWATPPYRFSDREAVFASVTHRDTLREVISSGRYKKIITTGAWSMGALLKACSNMASVKVAVDTHDVFFVMDHPPGSPRFYPLYRKYWQKRRELSALRAADHIVAISPSDGEALRVADSRFPVVVDTGSFEYASVLPEIEPVSKYSFGYIGTGNQANMHALSTLASVWWPEILQICPDAELFIAGKASATDLAADLCSKFPNRVKLLGFVPDLSGFYSSVRVMLSPIEIQGGLNFKSVEALVAGRELIVSELGGRCLETSTGVWKVTEATPIGAIISEIVKIDSTQGRRSAIQTDALTVYCESKGFMNLVRWAQS